MALNSAGLALTATALKANLLYAQLHSGSAGSEGTSNVAIPGRLPVTWATVSPTEFALQSQLEFRGGASGDPCYSVSLWDTETDGNFYGEYLLTGDNAFNNEGVFLVTQLDFLATSSDVDES